MNADYLRRVQFFFAHNPYATFLCLLFSRVFWSFAASRALMAPQELYEENASFAEASKAVGLVAVGVALAAAGHWLTQTSVRHSARLLGFSVPRRWWLWLPLGAAIGTALARGLAALHLPALWPALIDMSSEQLANNAQRDAGTAVSPIWMVWVHAAGEEMLFRMPVVAAACFALGFARARMTDASRARLGILAAVVGATTLLFGLIHLDYGWYNVVTAWVLGAGCAAIAIASRSVWPAATLHAAYNTANHFPDIVWSLW